jgi:hypothetical protein
VIKLGHIKLCHPTLQLIDCLLVTPAASFARSLHRFLPSSTAAVLAASSMRCASLQAAASLRAAPGIGRLRPFTSHQRRRATRQPFTVRAAAVRRALCHQQDCIAAGPPPPLSLRRQSPAAKSCCQAVNPGCCAAAGPVCLGEAGGDRAVVQGTAGALQVLVADVTAAGWCKRQHFMHGLAAKTHEFPELAGSTRTDLALKPVSALCCAS